MPIIDENLVLKATNGALSEMPPVVMLESLDSTQMSNSEWSCNYFAPVTLEKVMEASGGQGEPTNYKGNPETWPNSFPENSFVNFMIMFEDSSLNHNFNVYFDKANKSYLIQAYVGKEVRITTPQQSSDFIATWKLLATQDWAAAYQRLFYVQPETQENTYQEQHVTVIVGT